MAANVGAVGIAANGKGTGHFNCVPLGKIYEGSKAFSPALSGNTTQIYSLLFTNDP
jgi:hypothetical protein